MASATAQPPADFNLPRPTLLNDFAIIAAPGHESFTRTFGTAFPKPEYITSALGSTAVYNLFPSSGRTDRRVLIIHGVNTPALGMLPLAQELQTRDPNAHVVLFDLWGHGLSSTPLQAHTPHIFHSQILQVLGFMKWTSAHILGYSFGGATAVSFAIYNPWTVLSVVLLAPAGLLRMADFDSHLKELLSHSQGREQEARDAVRSWLEGGPLKVPEDWRIRVERGEVVAEALRRWELQEHQGYPYSVLSIFRDGGVIDRDVDFRQFAELPFAKMTVLGESDNVCSPVLLKELGLHDTFVVANADHSLVRSHKTQVAELVVRFWTG